MVKIIQSERPEEHWAMVDCCDRSILDLGCAYNDTDDEKTRENKLGTPQYFIGQKPSNYLGVDSFSKDIEDFRKEFTNFNFICDFINSSEKILKYIEDSRPQIVKSDIEGAEILFCGIDRLKFVEEICIEIHGPHIEKPFLEWAGGLKFDLVERAILGKHPNISVLWLKK